MTETRSPRVSRVFFWVLAPLALLTVAVLLLSVEIRSPKAVIGMVAIAASLTLLLLAFWDPNRFLWAGRTFAAMVFMAYVGFLGSVVLQATNDQGKPGHRARNSVVRALVGLVVIGWPALMFTIFGRFTLRPTVDDAVTPISPDDPLWLAALQKARDTIPLLRELHGKHEGQVAVKFPFQTDSGDTEHLWGRLLDLRQDDMWVTVLTPPLSHKGIPPQHVKLPVKDLEDWQLDLPDGKIRGGFSTRAQIQIYRRDRRVIPLEVRRIENAFVD